MIAWSHRLFFDRLVPLLGGGWAIVLAPILGGLGVGGLSYHFIGKETFHGVTGVLEAVARKEGELPYRRAPLKTLISAISIGSGASVGPEGPSVQIGANLGSFLGKFFSLGGEQVRLLVASGAAAGIASAFHAPIAGVFFAAEILLGEITSGSLGVVVLAALSGSALTQAISGTEPAFHIPHYELRSAWEYLFYLMLGLLTVPLSALYIRLLRFWRQFFHHLPTPRWTQPALAGIVLGLVGHFLHQILGIGYETIEAVLRGASLSIGLLLALTIAKMILTPLSLGSGYVGGVFAPALFLGAMFGAAYGKGINVLFLALNVAPAAFALVSKAAMLSGAVYVPLTAIFLLFEMTQDYRIILPLMLAVVVSLLISRRLERHSVYTLSLVQAGLRLDHLRLRRAWLGGAQLEAVTVEEEAPYAGQTVEKIHWPRRALIVALRCQRRTVIPRGRTQIRSGDLLIFIAESEAREHIYALCQSDHETA